MSKEAMKLALEALENAWLDASMGKGDVARHTDAITALREALAEQPAQPKGMEFLSGWQAIPKEGGGTFMRPITQDPVSNCLECANADSLGLPDKPCCRTCVTGSNWSPLNTSSVNPNRPAKQEPCCHAGIAHDCHAGPGCRIVKRLKAATQPAQQEPCDMEILCIGCSPKNSDGSCPSEKPNGACDCYIKGFNDGMKELEQPAQHREAAVIDSIIAEHGYPKEFQEFAAQLNARKAEQPAQEPVVFEIDWPEYNSHAMGCGLEDRGITSRYEAMQYGWDEALERMAECLPDELYTSPPAQQEPVSVTYKEVFDSMNVLYTGDIKQVQIAMAMENKKLYTSPQPSKPWVGLTLEDKQHIIDNNFGGSRADCMDEAEKILREKNA